MNMDRPIIQDHRDARRLRSGGAPVREERRQRRPAHRRRPPGAHLARHDVQPAHAAPVAIGRPTPFRPHLIGARPSIPVGQGRAPGDRDVIPIHGRHLVGVRVRILPHVRNLLQVGLSVRIRARPMPAGARPGEAQPIPDAGDPAQRGVAPPRQRAADGVQGPARLGQPTRPRVTADQLLPLRRRRLGVMVVRGNKRACARVRPGWGDYRCPRRPSDSASERRFPDGADAARVRAPRRQAVRRTRCAVMPPPVRAQRAWERDRAGLRGPPAPRRTREGSGVPAAHPPEQGVTRMSISRTEYFFKVHQPHG